MIIDIKTHDGYVFKGKLLLPDGNENILKLVISIDGAGPTTYNTYKNAFSPELYTNNGVAFFSYNTRGVNVTDESPFYVINFEEYKTYLPSNSIKDIFNIINTIKQINRLKSCKVFLNGWSEGATLAPLFATKYPHMVDALFLCGYSNVNFKDLQKWQCSRVEGGSAIFDEFYSAFERNDNEWLMNRMGLTAEWFLESYSLKSNNDLLPSLDLPIYIFQGAMDGFCDVQGVYKIRDIFTQLGKSNLTVNVFENLGHGLDIINSSDEETSDGIKLLFNTIQNL